MRSTSWPALAEVAGVLCLVVAAFLVAIPLGLAALGAALLAAAYLMESAA